MSLPIHFGKIEAYTFASEHDVVLTIGTIDDQENLHLRPMDVIPEERYSFISLGRHIPNNKLRD